MIFLILNVRYSVPTNAANISLAVSPSKIYNQQIDYGATKDFSFYIANKSDNSNGKSANMTITTDIEAEDSNGRAIDTKNIAKCNISKFDINVNEEKKINIKLSIPAECKQDIPEGNYIFYVIFKQTSVNGFSLGSQVSAIKVPMYIFIGNKAHFTAKKINFKVNDNYIDFSEKPQSILGYSLHYIKRCLNPLNVQNELIDILNKPVFNFSCNKKSDNQQVDINNDFYTELSKVATTHKSFVSSKKYVYYKAKDINQKIAKCYNYSDHILIQLKNKDTIKISCNVNEISAIYNQITALAYNKQNITLEDFMAHIQVPKDSNYTKVYPTLVSTIKSESDIPIVLQETFSTTKNNISKIAQNTMTTATIKENEVKDIKSIIASSNLTSGQYNVKGTYSIKNHVEKFDLTFKIRQQRIVIFIIVLIFNTLYFGTILGVLYKISKIIIKAIKK